MLFFLEPTGENYTQDITVIVVAVGSFIFLIVVIRLSIFIYYKQNNKKHHQDDDHCVVEGTASRASQELGGQHLSMIPHATQFVDGKKEKTAETLELLHYSTLPSYEEAVRNTPTEPSPLGKEDIH